MTKIEYLQKMKRSLWLHFSKEEMQEILLDYSEYFENGQAEGELESAVAERLGNPKTVSKELIAERRKSVSALKYGLLALCLLCIGFCLWLSYQDNFYLYFGQVTFYAIPLIILVVAGGAFCLTIPAWSKPLRPHLITRVLGWIATIWTLTALAFLFVWLLDFTIWYPNSWFPWMQGLRDFALISPKYWIILAWLCLPLDRCSYSARRQSLHLWYGGLLAGTVCFYHLFHGLEQISDLYLVSTWANMFWPMALGMAVGVVLFLIFSFREKRKGKK